MRYYSFSQLNFALLLPWIVMMNIFVSFTFFMVFMTQCLIGTCWELVPIFFFGILFGLWCSVTTSSMLFNLWLCVLLLAVMFLICRPEVSCSCYYHIFLSSYLITIIGSIRLILDSCFDAFFMLLVVSFFVYDSWFTVEFRFCLLTCLFYSAFYFLLTSYCFHFQYLT